MLNPFPTLKPQSFCVDEFTYIEGKSQKVKISPISNSSKLTLDPACLEDIFLRKNQFNMESINEFEDLEFTSYANNRSETFGLAGLNNGADNNRLNDMGEELINITDWMCDETDSISRDCIPFYCDDFFKMPVLETNETNPIEPTLNPTGRKIASGFQTTNPSTDFGNHSNKFIKQLGKDRSRIKAAKGPASPKGANDTGTSRYIEKREKNNQSVRKSRDKARRRRLETEERVKNLAEENKKLNDRVVDLQRELEILKNLFMNVSTTNTNV